MIQYKNIIDNIDKYKNPWLLINNMYGHVELSREDILEIVDIFNKNSEYK